MIMPVGVNSCTRLGELNFNFCAVNTIQTTAINTDGYANALLLFCGRFTFGLFKCSLVSRAQFVDHLRQREHLRGLTGRGSITGTISIDIAEFQRIHAYFFSQFIDGAFRRELSFRSAITTEGSTPNMIGADGLSKSAHIGDVITSTDILSAAQGEQITKLRVGAVIADPVGFEGNDLALGISSDLDIGEERRAFTGVLHVLLVVIVQRNGAAGGHAGNAEQGFHGR
ncbi:hypothetical protein SDC9_99672 [bioreactor metagenome]|uniref:Uncharacterized protein n=1 Tax=bioreactor metagenome TaxID=1076179 RepID=A0A645AJJ5_9ZZZZ